MDTEAITGGVTRNDYLPKVLQDAINNQLQPRRAPSEAQAFLHKPLAAQKDQS